MPKVIPEYKEEAKKRIIEVSLEVFCKKGYQATKMVDIASELGISKGAIYTYFKNKSDLFTQTAQYYRQNFENEMNERSKLLEDRDFFDLIFDYFAEYQKLGYVLTFEIMNLSVNDEELKAFIINDGKKDREYFLQYLTHLREEGKIREDIDVEELCDHINVLFYGLYLWMFLELDLDKAKKIWDNAIKNYR
ncbi:MAG: TetR/AcrR family transcriptional regulator [Methanomicrobiaceae archaeon]|nr:TetR/AcrR family transcriptional regulator [Methanomicrobiaceae archaeon]